MHPGSEDSSGPAPEAELEGRLADAHAAVLAREAERRRASHEPSPSTPHPPARLVAAAATSWVLVALAIISPPAMLRGAEGRPYTPAPAQLQPSLRYGIWLANHRVVEFARQEGRLPASLREAGMDDPAIAYEMTGKRSFRLTAHAGDTPLRFESAMSVDSFLGMSMAHLRAKPPD